LYFSKETCYVHNTPCSLKTKNKRSERDWTGKRGKGRVYDKKKRKRMDI
jgi:hypothetical protein